MSVASVIQVTSSFAVLCCHLWTDCLYQNFPIYLKNEIIFEKFYWTQNVCFDFVYNVCQKHFSLKEGVTEIRWKMYSGLLAKYISCPILIKFIFLTDFQKKNAQIPNFMKNRPVGAELFHANRQTKIETTKLSVSRFVILGTHLLQKKTA